MNLRPLLLLPGLVIGYVAVILLGFASAAVFGDNALVQLGLAVMVVITAAAVLAKLRLWARWLGGGAVGGAAVAVAWWVVVSSMFPPAASVTDKAGSRIADEHLAGLERTVEFQAAPDGYRLGKSWRQSGCSDWFDRREPATVRQYDATIGPPEEAMAFFGDTWKAAGYRQLDLGNRRPDFHYAAWEREQDGWTAILSVYVDNDVVEVAGRDAGSHACK